MGMLRAREEGNAVVKKPAINAKRGPDFGPAWIRTLEQNLATNRLPALHEGHDAEESETEKCGYRPGLRNFRRVAVKVRERGHGSGTIGSAGQYKILGNADAFLWSGQHQIRDEVTRGVVDKKCAIGHRKADLLRVGDIAGACDERVVQLDMDVGKQTSQRGHCEGHVMS